MNGITETIITIATGVIGLATLAVLVSRNANTAGVIREGGNAFSGLIRAATGPVMGGGGSSLSMSSFTPNVMGN